MSSNSAKKIADGFLEYLRKSGNSALLSEIVEVLSQKVDTDEVRATIFSAAPLSTGQKKNINEILQKQFNVSDSQFEIDESLIGGIKVAMGNRVLDLSFKNKLDQLTQ